MASRQIRTVLILGLGLLCIVGTVLLARSSLPTHLVKDQSGPAAPTFEILPDRVIVRVTASEVLHPATTTPHHPDAPHSDWFYSEPITLPEDIVISGFAIEMENADLSALHHTRVGVLNRMTTLCTIRSIETGGMHDFFTASRETLDPVMLPEPYGLVWYAGERLAVEFMTHPMASPHGAHESTETITPTLKVTMFTDSSRTLIANYLRLSLDDTPCEEPQTHQAFVVPAATELYVKSADKVGGSARYIFPKAGRILIGGSNFWPRKGGENVTAYLNDAAFDVSKATAGETSYEWQIPHKTLDVAFSVGDTLTIDSLYTNPSDTPIKDASGMYGIYYTYEESIVRRTGTTTPSE